MPRSAVPKATREAVLAEFKGACAICAAHSPQLHHIDENPQNHAASNLIPLCPNCHLRDQHNPTHQHEPEKLRLFRLHKDPAILKAQFHAVFLRQRFLQNLQDSEDDVEHIERDVEELIALVECLEMGRFYAKQIDQLISPQRRPAIIAALAENDPKYLQQVKDENRLYRRTLLINFPAVQALLIEQLRFQLWANEA